MPINILLIVFAAIVILVLFVCIQPGAFNYTSSTLVNATPEAIFPYINNLRAFNEWSPWVKMDPDAAVIFDGADSGVDAAMEWSGKKTGAGKMTIIETIPFSLIRMRLDFRKPMKATNRAEFTLLPEGNATRVSWGMYGSTNFTGKAIGLFMDCKKMCESQFDKGLADLKTTVESNR